MAYQFEMTADDEVLWRYMAVQDFLWMVVESRLMLRLPSTFTDPFEGQLTKPTIEDLRRWEGPATDESRSKVQLMMLSGLGVSSWHRQEHESDLMWRTYGGSDGVAVRTTARKLRRAVRIRERTEPAIVGNVNYVNYDEYRLDGLDVVNALCHKRQEFLYEREARLIVLQKSLDAEDVRVEGPVGFSVPVDVNALVDSVITAPRASWFAQALARICGSLGATFEVLPSQMVASAYRLYDEVAIRALIPVELRGKVVIPEHVFVLPGEEFAHAQTDQPPGEIGFRGG